MHRDEIVAKARAWTQKHVPIFAVATSYGESAFVAGYEAAMNERKGNDGNRERSEDI